MKHAWLLIAALLLGALVLFRRKGTPLHKAMGRAWVILMLVVATSAASADSSVENTIAGPRFAGPRAITVRDATCPAIHTMLQAAEKGVPLQAALAEWVAQVRVPSNVRLAIDIDPQSFL